MGSFSSESPTRFLQTFPFRTHHKSSILKDILLSGFLCSWRFITLASVVRFECKKQRNLEVKRLCPVFEQWMASVWTKSPVHRKKASEQTVRVLFTKLIQKSGSLIEPRVQLWIPGSLRSRVLPEEPNVLWWLESPFPAWQRCTTFVCPPNTRSCQ